MVEMFIKQVKIRFWVGVGVRC